MRRALVIDDEPNSRDLLTFLLREYLPHISVLGTAASAEEGIQLIRDHQPDLIFLDIELFEGDGFQVLEAFEPPSFEVVFTSGYHPSIVSHLKYASLPFLTKPILLHELQTLALALPALPIQQDQVDLVKNYEAGRDKESLFISGRSAYHKVVFRDIAFVQAQGTCVRIVLVTGGEHFSSYNLSHFEGLLPSDLFFRAHRSYLVNLSLVIQYDPGRAGMLHLKGGQSIPIAARRKAQFVQLMKVR